MIKLSDRITAAVLAVGTIASDRLTKHLATLYLADRPTQSYLSDILRLEYAENTGAFLSLGANLSEQSRTLIFTGGVSALLITVAVLAVLRRWAGLTLAGAVLMWAGGLSNLIDRARHGSVVDFMSIGLGSLRTGIFNVADIAIMAGAILILFGEPHRDKA